VTKDSRAAAGLVNFRATGLEDNILCEHGELKTFYGHGFPEHGFADSRRDSPELLRNAPSEWDTMARDLY
jgi:hypothetical protein